MVELEGGCDVDADDFNMLIGPGPYPINITSSPNFTEIWPILQSALHGVQVCRYLAYCDDILGRCKRLPAWHIFAGLNETYDELVVEYNKIAVAARHHSERGEDPEACIATHNMRWISRIIVYIVDDMVAVKEGTDVVLRTLCDRMWTIRHSPNM